jgi:hypothetical protein
VRFDRDILQLVKARRPDQSTRLSQVQKLQHFHYPVLRVGIKIRNVPYQEAVTGLVHQFGSGVMVILNHVAVVPAVLGLDRIVYLDPGRAVLGLIKLLFCYFV